MILLTAATLALASAPQRLPAPVALPAVENLSRHRAGDRLPPAARQGGSLRQPLWRGAPRSGPARQARR
jgi:hypothetical protein